MTLFLDRDGVINERTPGDYITRVEDFHFLPGVLEAFPILAKYFDHIFVVTNQQGIGKKLMTRGDLEAIHAHLLAQAKAVGGRIDAAYYCPHLAERQCYCRKPESGMAWDAKSHFPKIDYAQSWMVGDSASDIIFGQRLGMKTALVPGKKEDAEQLSTLEPTLRVDSLLSFALGL